MRTPSRRRRLERLFAPSGGGGAWAGLSVLNPALNDVRLEGDDFQYADIAAAVTAWTPRFPDYIYTTGLSIDNSIQYEGKSTLRIPESNPNTGEAYLELSKYAGNGSSTDYWWRVVCKLPSTYHANLNRLLLGAGGTTNFAGHYSGAEYSTNYGGTPTDESFFPAYIGAVEDSAPYSLASLKALGWFAVATHIFTSGGIFTQEIYLNDTLMTTASASEANPDVGLLDMDIDCECTNAATPDPTNNYLNIALFEYRNDVPDPWGLL